MDIVHRLLSTILLLGIVAMLASCGVAAVGNGPPQVGSPAPTFTLPLLAGGEFDLADHQGSVVVVNFWASWCGPCEEETPRLQRWHETYQDAGLMLVGVDVLERDSREAVEAFVQKYGVSYPVPLDAEGAVARQWLAQQLPRSYVIDRAGIVRFARIGELTDRDFENHIQPLLDAR